MKTFENFAFILAIILVSLLLVVFKFRTSYKYYVPVAWEHQQGKTGGQPVITNVVKLPSDCPAANAQITNDLYDYYKGSLSKKRGFTGLHKAAIKGPFDKADQANKIRSALIREFDDEWNPLLVTDFATFCDH
ncbi:hypothetical protein FLCU109888_02820 [Flavobacterium cucumis]|uniref:Uncharacterized protein n=1 Tax=Flavobacterium cucumis TaxID=416016 RepID=A0A1M7ZUJ5_9FLAO|nr:hypothetical protein [Flavobacterium cucumis]SHO72526.1 hypothetical protein SAMN05443547_0860 [Flavobacterium cucumis]